MAHVVFNVLTAGVALALLPWLVDVLSDSLAFLSVRSDPAVELAMFHTVFNIAGVVLIWPLADRLTAWLARRFRRREEDESQPRHLDDNVLAVPALAIDALAAESKRIGHLANTLLRSAIRRASPQIIEQEHAVVQRLSDAAASFVGRIHRGRLSASLGHRLALALRVLRYQENVVEQAFAAAPLLRDDSALPPELAAAEAQFLAGALSAIDAIDKGQPDWPGSLPVFYEALKSAMLAAAASGSVPLPAMEQRLRAYSAIRRALEQAHKACHASCAAADTAAAPAASPVL